MAFGWLLFVFVAPPESYLTWKQQLQAFTKVYSNWRIMILIPMFYCANIPYYYQQNSVNGATFTIRSGSLNSALYWLAQVFGGLFIGCVLDIPSLRRSNRAKLGWVIAFVLTFAIYGGGFAFQKWADQRPKSFLDFSDVSEFVGPCFLYICYGMYDALFQSLCYWTMGALSNDPYTIARYVTLYKTFQASGGAMAWRINALHKPAMTRCAMSWGLLAAALVIAFLALWTIKEPLNLKTMRF
ncbi:hypothetical protein M422DRAFT_245919 [Sphaerobolus stellatus SS14]|nr:hypothetical protein M422DRAFT_245919 [Sphaerobolus stellatus SS14]